MGVIEDNSKWFFKRLVFLWVPFAAIFILIKKMREERNKKED
jgi:hypothetical protein